MNTEEAKFILSAYRSDGRYEGDPVFEQALTQAYRDPSLLAWLANEQALDNTVADKIEAIHPPEGLRESILAGARVSRRRRAWWAQPSWMAIAAALIIIAAAPTMFLSTKAVSEPLTAMTMARYGLEDTVVRHFEHTPFIPELSSFENVLKDHQGSYTSGLDIDFEALRATSCRTIMVDKHAVYEICFLRDGTWFHFYMGRTDGPTTDTASHPVFMEKDGYAAAGWSDGEFTYTLAVQGGVEVLKRLV